MNKKCINTGCRRHNLCKKMLVALCGSLLAAGSVCASAGEGDVSRQMRLGYTAGNMGLSLGYMTRLIVKGAIELEPSKLEPISGSSITSLRIAVGNKLTCQNNYVFITDDLYGEPLYRQDVAEFHYGWNEVALDVPFEIDGRRLFVGYRYESEGETLSLDGEKDNDLANWISISQTSEEGGSWEHQGGGALNIQAVVEGDNLPQNDIAIDRHSIVKYGCQSQPMPLHVVVRNMGAATVRSLGYTVSFDGKEVINGTAENLEIISNDLALINLGELVFDRNTIGDIDVRIDEVNGVADETPGDNGLTVANVIVRKDYTPRTVLLEQFTSTYCNNCPNASHAIIDAFRFRPGIAHVTHHSGFRKDIYTIPESESYVWLYTDGTSGSTYAPAAMLDRTNMSSAGASNGSGGSTPGPVFAVERDRLGGLIDDRLSTPALVSVNAVSRYDRSAAMAYVTVSGNIPNGSPERLNAKDPRLTVMLVEDYVEGPQTGVTTPLEGEYVHRNVVRAVLTGVWGDPVTFADGAYKSSEYSVAVPEGWDVKNMHVVAFIADFDASSPNKCQVFNAADVRLADAASVEKVVAGEVWKPSVVGGLLALPAGCHGLKVFNTMGVKVAEAGNCDNMLSLRHLAKGIYLVVAETGGAPLTAKIIMR